MIRRFAIALALSLAAGLCTAQAGGAADAVSVSDAYARAVPPGQPNSVVFMNLANRAHEAHALVAAESGVADVVELHTHAMEDGMMKMRRVGRIDLPAGETVNLEPGGLHLMLIGLERQLAPDEQVDLTLIFEDGSRARITAPVRRVETDTGGHGKEHNCGGGRCGGGG